MWNWLKVKRLELKKTWVFSWPDASRDRCLDCNIERRYHAKEHKFVEKEK